MFSNILSENELNYIKNLPEVLEVYNKLKNSNLSKISFTIQLNDDLKQSLINFGLNNLENINEIPMRWIKGDTLPHIDASETNKNFENTYLIYLTNNTGKIIINNIENPIIENTGYIFNKGTIHGTINAGNEPRLMIGPMNEYINPVGVPPSKIIYYFSNKNDADTNVNQIAMSVATFESGYSFTIGELVDGNINGYTSWKKTSDSFGYTNDNIIYNNGETQTNIHGDIKLYPNTPCFLDGTNILCLVNNVETYLSIDKLDNNTLVKTLKNGYKKIQNIGYSYIMNTLGNYLLYKCPKTNYPELLDDLFITADHSILVDKLHTDEYNNIFNKYNGKIFITENKYRLMVEFDKRAEKWEKSGKFKIWHFSLENNDINMNYGVYANGLLVETTSIKFLKHFSNMTII